MRLHVSNDTQVKFFAGTGAALAVVASSDVAPAEVRLVAGAIAAACSAVLALMRQTGHPPTPPTTGSP
jgi:hypothetical protein